MDKDQVASILDETGTLLELQGENPFRCNAYTKAARAIGQLESNLAEVITAGQLDQIPGIDQARAESIVAEVGLDMQGFPTEGHRCSWAGICSGNNESAGKRRSGRIPKGDRWLRRTLVLAASGA